MLPRWKVALPADLFGRYLACAGGDRAHALNVRLPEALDPSPPMLEVMPRNLIHTICPRHSNPDRLRQDD